MLCPDVPAATVEDAFDAALGASEPHSAPRRPRRHPTPRPVRGVLPAFAVAVEHAGFLAARALVFADEGADEVLVEVPTRASTHSPLE